MKKLSTKILEINKKTESVSEFVLGVSEELDFQNGQFLIIYIPDKKIIEKNGEKIVKNIFLKRAYSIVDFVFDKKNNSGKIILWIKNQNGRGTKYLFSRSIGEKLNISCSFGHFFVNGNKKNICFIATGIGIPPIISHIKNIFEDKKEEFKDKKIQLIYGIRKREDFFCEEILKKFSKENKNFSYKIFFSREDEKISEECEYFEKGYCTEFLKNKNGDFKNSEFYFCGSVPLMKEIGEKLENFGVGKKDFVFEAY